MNQISEPFQTLVLVYPRAAGHERFVLNGLNSAGLFPTQTFQARLTAKALKIMYPCAYPVGDSRPGKALSSLMLRRVITVFVFQSNEIWHEDRITLGKNGKGDHVEKIPKTILDKVSRAIGCKPNPWNCHNDSIQKALVRKFRRKFPKESFSSDEFTYHTRLVHAPKWGIEVLEFMNAIKLLEKKPVDFT